MSRNSYPHSSSVAILMVAMAYAVAAKVSFLVTIPPGNISPIYPSAGIALAAVLILGRPALFGIWLGSFAANTVSFFDGTVTTASTVSTSLLVASLIGIGAMLGAGIGAFLVRRFCKGEHPLDKGESVLMLVAAGALGACMISATFGVFFLSLVGYVPWDGFDYNWLTWWLGDSMGAIIAAPLILAWHHQYPFHKTPWRVVEAALLGVMTLLLCFFVFFRNAPFEYGLTPLLLWAAFRFGTRGTSSASAAIAIFATIETIQGSGPFMTDTVNESILHLDLFLGVTSVSALVLAGVLVERRQAEQAREQLMKQMELLSERLATGQEEERRKIAYELHEELGQELATLKFYLQTMGPDSGGTQSKASQEEALALAAHATERVRNLVLDIQPSELADFGLDSAVRAYCQRQAVRGGWNLHIDAPEPDGRAPRLMERACFRVLQEGLSNILQHAKATEVWVHLRQDNNELELKIRDNGIGFDRNAIHENNRRGRGGLGLFGMQIRARQVGGAVEINSTAGGGTAVRAVFPLSVTPVEPV